MIKAYCVRCAVDREVVDVMEVTMKENKKAQKGMCAVCGDTVFSLSDDSDLAKNELNN